jgi:hypothetical protein
MNVGSATRILTFPNSFFPTRVVIVSLYLDVTNYITMGMFVQKNNYGGCGWWELCCQGVDKIVEKIQIILEKLLATPKKKERKH